MLTNLAAFAEYYSRNLSTEVKKGLREKAQQGGWIGPIPFGHMIAYIYDAKGERLTRLLAHTTLPTPKVLHVTKALELLGDIDALLEVATVEQQRTLLQQVFETVWIEKFAVTAIKPAANYALLVEAVASGCFWRPRLGLSPCHPHRVSHAFHRIGTPFRCCGRGDWRRSMVRLVAAAARAVQYARAVCMHRAVRSCE